ncbi:MAG: SH3 domain-containing protein [Lachnospiraceae bacterium]|nr:SH3 domain-containing protein [Lachnospiraceae bacterium]
MKRRRFKIWAAGIVTALLAAAGSGMAVQAAFEQTVEAAYNTAVQGQEAMAGLDVSVTEVITAAGTNTTVRKTVSLKVSDSQSSAMKADIRIQTDEGSTESYYADNYYYTTTSDGKVKREMDQGAIWQIINSHTYANLTSNYLKMLTQPEAGIYYYAATPDTLGSYSKNLLEGADDGQGIVIDSLQGTMWTDKAGNVTQRSLTVVYTVTTGEQSETFLIQTSVKYNHSGKDVTVELPNLTEYEEKTAEQPIEIITPLTQTVYVTSDVNVRASGDISAVILGGLNAGSGVLETGYTSDGWTQIQYNGAAGYVWSDYVTTTEPVLTKTGTGTMYAQADVNVRTGYSSEGGILGTLSKGTSIEITGTTSNGWIRVKYNGGTGYVYGDYLSWAVPVVNTYVENGYMSGVVTDASFGTLTIQRDDGQGTATFNTTYAQLNFKDTLYTGDWVEVSYSGAGAPYTASSVTDYTSHEDAAESQSISVEGIVLSLTPDKLELQGSDGLLRTFDISEAEQEMTEGLYEGKAVVVTWMSSTNGAETRNVKAMRIQGE